MQGAKTYMLLRPALFIMMRRSEHLRLVVLLRCFRGIAAVTARTSWTAFFTAWATVTSAVVAARATLTVVTAWTTVSARLALRLHITLRLLDEGLA